jgi:hypothetical protein
MLTLDDQTSAIYMCAVSVELLQLQGSTEQGSMNARGETEHRTA